MTEKLVYEVLFAVVVAIAGIVAKTLIPYLKQKEAEALAKLRQTQWGFAADIIEAVVRAVEQTVSEEIHGEDKKAIAVRYITDIFRQNGIDLSHEQIDKLIEAAVQAMNQQSIQIELPDEPVEE